MPKGRYTIGARGTHGCSGYPVVGDTGKVHGCHKTRAQARAQQAAIYASEASNKSYEYYSEDSAIRKGCCPELDKAQGPCWDGYEQRGMKEKDGKMVPNCVPKDSTNKSMTISQNSHGCNGYAIINENGELKGCYNTRQEAEAAMAQHESSDNEMSNPGHDTANKSFWSGMFN